MKGKIANSRNGELLTDAKIKTTDQITFADLDGSFTLKNITDETHRFVFSFIGYQTLHTTIIVSSGRNNIWQAKNP